MTAVDHSAMKLGKGAPRLDHRTLRLADFLVPAALPPVKEAVDNLAPCPDDMSMMLNDEQGDCTCAAVGHFIQLATANRGGIVTPPDSAIEKAYEDVGGFRPGDPSTDQGAVILDVLNYWRKTGVGGFKIDGFAALQPQNPDHIKLAIDLGGAVDIGLALPISAQTQEVWDLDPGQGRNARPGSWGGHSVIVGAYDAHGLTCVTWGRRKRMTWPYWYAYCDESWLPLSELWAPKAAANGINMAALMAAAKQLGIMA
jgi:hypothetical protein